MTPPTAAIPCPWCNGKTLIGMRWLTRDIPKWWGFCTACKARQDESTTEEEAIAKWNRRAAPAVQATADADGATEMAKWARFVVKTLKAVPRGSLGATGPKSNRHSMVLEILGRYDALKSAVSPKAAASKDMVLVPRRATKEMCAAYALQVGYSRMPGDVWDAMISAAVSGDKQEKERE